jgi:ABC-2 type transport system permease protein
MFSTLFRWELRALRRDPAFWVAVVLSLTAIIFAVTNGAHWLAHLDTVRASAAQADTAARATARAFAAKPDPNVSPFRDPRTPAGYANSVMAHFATLPATPLAALTIGQSDLLPSAIPLTPAANPVLASAAEPENPHRLLIGRFDAAFAIVFLAPLLIIALTHALLAGERERGTLALLLAQPVTLRALLVGRLAPRALLGLVLVAVLTLAFVVSTNFSLANAVPRLLLWLAVALVYGAFWFALSLAVIARRGSAATHAIALAALWLVFVALVPSGINLAVKTLHPVPSRMELILALRAATDAANSDRSKLLAAYYEDHPELAPPGQAATANVDAQFLRVVSGERIERDLAPVLARYEAQLARQQALVEKLQFLSPALLVQSALADAAGTGLSRHRAFLAQVAAHHAELRAFFHPRILRKETFAAWDDVPEFRYVEEPAKSVAGRLAPTFAVLTLGATALAAWGWRALARYPMLA